MGYVCEKVKRGGCWQADLRCLKAEVFCSRGSLLQSRKLDARQQKDLETVNCFHLFLPQINTHSHTHTQSSMAHKNTCNLLILVMSRREHTSLLSSQLPLALNSSPWRLPTELLALSFLFPCWWNDLPNSTRASKSVATFKKLLKSL